MLNQKPTEGPPPKYLVFYITIEISPAFISAKCKPQKQRSRKDLNGKLEGFLLSVPHMQPCGDKKQIFEPNPHPQPFSLHLELVL